MNKTLSLTHFSIQYKERFKKEFTILKRRLLLDKINKKEYYWVDKKENQFKMFILFDDIKMIIIFNDKFDLITCYEPYFLKEKKNETSKRF